MTGDAVPVAQQVGFNAQGATGFSVSNSGTLAYRSREGPARSKLIWLDRSGLNVGETPGEFDNRQVALASDGARLAIDRFENNSSSNRDLWLVDTRRGTTTRFTSEPSDDCCPIWSPDDRSIVFPSNRDGAMNLYQRSSEGTEPAQLLLKTPLPKYPKDWSQDGRFVVYESGSDGNLRDLWLLPMFGERKPVPLISTRAEESDGRFSPDANWLAYTSNQSGAYEVYLQRITSAEGQRFQVSTNGGHYPRWRADGRELFYVAPDRKLMSVNVSLGERPQLGVPQPLFDMPISSPAAQPFTTRYAVAKDGQRFIVHNALSEQDPTALTVVVNWTEALTK